MPGHDPLRVLPDMNVVTNGKRLSILGATGSIGVSTLDAISHMGGREAFEIVALTGSSNVALLAKQARQCGAKLAVTADESRYGELRDLLCLLYTSPSPRD